MSINVKGKVPFRIIYFSAMLKHITKMSSAIVYFWFFMDLKSVLCDEIKITLLFLCEVSKSTASYFGRIKFTRTRYKHRKINCSIDQIEVKTQKKRVRNTYNIDMVHKSIGTF